ncbi:MAG: hypothetical protein M3397_09260 [Actinomycetota bacterium]|nr:hypothetical protein [Rubrobacter sp.]MBA3790966.1 hypothetical protein [Rubrobacter sp.]MDQ3236284.1 hypothetical protein [Actinomycetota bacterium]MDQ3568255.1 hypothetical protein [Actinomycetota bacterium]
MDLASIAQIASAIGTLVLAALTFAYVLFTREMVKEARETRIIQERPEVIVDADYSDRDVVDVVVRNIGKGAAKDVTFDFSTPMESSTSIRKGSEGVPLNELPYFKEGIEFLAPGAEIRAFWDTYIGLFPLLRNKGLSEGITITSRYKSLAGKSYETRWTINPLRLSGTPHVKRRGENEIAKAVESISKDLHRVVSLRGLKIISRTEQREEDRHLQEQTEADRAEAGE